VWARTPPTDTLFARSLLTALLYLDLTADVAGSLVWLIAELT
jgi:hypothetical protein